jgi:hypothetical protein
MKKIIRYYGEALSNNDKLTLLDIEADIIDLKKDLVTADDIQKQDINQRITDLKAQAEVIKLAGEEN